MHDASLRLLQDLVRIPSVNPPSPDWPDAELQVAKRIAAELGDVGLEPELVEPITGRASVHVRLRAEEPSGASLLLLSHLDVVPVSEAGWTYPPFGAVIADGYLYGRGAVDMKAAVAMQLSVIRALALEAQAAGRDPHRHGIPGLRRDVLFTCTADEEEGGTVGARWIVENRPEWLRSEGALSECGAVSITVAGRRLYPIQVAEKGSAGYRISIRGEAGHSSMPRANNAVLLAAEVIRRLSAGGPIRITPLMRQVIMEAASVLGPSARVFVDLMEREDSSAMEAAVARSCDPNLGGAFLALLRDTFSPNVVHSGIKYSMIPGEAMVEVGCRMLPGSSEPDLRAEIGRRLGEDLLSKCDITLIRSGPPVEAPPSGRLFETLVECIRGHDPEGIPVPAMAPYSTDARHTALLGVPTYGFTPLKLESEDRFLDQFHGNDERVSISGMRWGLPVLYDAVKSFCL